MKTFKIYGQVDEYVVLKCPYCGKELNENIVHYDHWIPLHEQEINDIDNFQALCGDCHTKKSKEELRKRAMRKRFSKKKEKLDLISPSEKF